MRAAGAFVAFGRSEFMEEGKAARTARCAALARVASDVVRQRGERDFHGVVQQVVDDLRAAGHDLWSYDEEDEFEVWGPNYVDGSRAGLIITFHADGRVEAVWGD